MSQAPRGFFTAWVVTCVAATAVVGMFNVLVDPYALFGAPKIAGFNERKSIVSQKRMIAAYEVTRFQPNSIVLGSSRVVASIDARDAAWPPAVRPTYNLGIPGADAYMAHRYLQHAMAYRDLALVVVGLDFEYYVDFKDGMGWVEEHSNYESRIAVTQAGDPNPTRQQHVIDLIRTLAFNGTKDSAATVLANMAGRGPYLLDGNFEANDRIYASGEQYLMNFVGIDLLWIRKLHGFATTAKIKQEKIQQLQSILEQCRSQGARVIFFINPMHADLMEIYDQSGLWPLFEEWKREVTMLVARFSNTQSEGAVVLWDFSGYHELSTESVSSGRIPLKTYSDPTHYRRAVGSQILTRFFGGGDARFGVVLTPDNIEEQLATIRTQQRSYRSHQVADVERVRKMYDAAIRDMARAKS